MPRNPSAITDSLSVDPALNQDSNYRFNSDDRQYIDNQIRGIEQHLVDALIRSRHATYYIAAVDLPTGAAVCLASVQGPEPQVTLATSTPLGNAKAVAGVVVRAAPAGGRVLVCDGGTLPPSITTLALGAPGYVKVNTSSGGLLRVASLSSGDFGIGFVDNAGFLLVSPGLSASGGGGGGASSVSAGDGIRVTNVGSAYTVHGDRGTCTPEMFGAVGDGTTDDTAALNSAAAALLAGAYHTLKLGARNYKRTSGSFSLPGGCSLIAQGSGASILSTTANAPLVVIAGEDWFVSGITFQGNGTGTSQHGLSDGDTAVAGSGHSRGIFTNCKLLNLGGCGFYYAENPLDGGASTYNGPLVANVIADGCGVAGFYTATRGEYVRFSNCESQRCAIGMRVGAGNVGVVGGSHTANSIGIQIDAGANDSHGEFVGVACNHSILKGLVVGAITNGHHFVTCDFFENGGLWFTSSVGVTFSACRLDAGSYNFDGSTGTLFDSCRISTAYGNAVNDNAGGHASDTRWVNCTSIDGTIPAFVGDRTRLSKAISDANTTLSKQESVAETVVVSGTLTATRTVTWALPPNKGRRTLVRNLTSQTLNLGWSTGTTVSLASGLAAILGADGTNATVELTESTGGGGGEANTASNLGTGGAGLFNSKVGVDLQFKSLKQTSPIGLSVTSSDVTINFGGLTGFGTSLQVLRTNAAGTAAEWATVSGGGSSSVGSSGQLDVADGAGGWVAATNVLAGSNFVSIGASPSTTGLLRVPLASQQIIGAGGKAAIATSTTEMFVGCDSAFANQFSGVRIYGSSLVYMGIGSTTYIGNDASLGRVFFNVDTQYGAGNMPATGKLRFLNSPGAIAVTRDSGNTADMTALYGAASSLYVGATSSNTNRFANCYIYPSTQLGLGVNGTTAIEIDTSTMSFDRPVVGLVSPYSCHGAVGITITASRSLTTAEYSRKYWAIGGSGTFNATVPAPADADHSYFVLVTVGGAGQEVTFTTGTGSAATITSAMGLRVLSVSTAGCIST